MIERVKRYVLSWVRAFKRLRHEQKRQKWLSFFCSCDDGHHDFCTNPDSLFIALNDAANNMSYSNWHTSKFYIIQDILKQLYTEYDIPLKLEWFEYENDYDPKEIKS